MGLQPEKGIVNRGNQGRIKAVMKRAKAGEKLTLGFLGGSITQGSLSSTAETCYAYLVYEWWKKTFPEGEFVYLNAGIGGTTSQFGVARAESDLLQYKPDFVIVEFSVNDVNNDFFLETYEGLIRKIYGNEKRPAVLIVHNVCYDTGVNAQDKHLQVGKYYDIPCVSMKETIYPLLQTGELTNREITPDDLHPNDRGHSLVAQVITYFLDQVYAGLAQEEETEKAFPQPFTQNGFETSVRFQNYNAKAECTGFEADRREQENIREIFRNGWTAGCKGDKIILDIEGTGIAVQYRKSVQKPTPVAVAVIDGDEEKAITLDGNFEEDWGDCLYLTEAVTGLEHKVHKVEIRIVETHEKDAVPFYLVSVIGPF